MDLFAPERLASYVGLTSQTRQSGNHRAAHNHVPDQGNIAARTALIKAARVPTPRWQTK
ncbi:transposase [Paracoccus aerius]